MPVLSTESIQKLGTLQDQIWQTVTTTVNEGCDLELAFTTPLTVNAKMTDMYAEASAPALVIQFSFADLPENPQVVLIPRETLAMLAASVSESEEEREVDESVVTDHRAIFETIVQGLCVGIGNHRGEPIVASGLTIRYQIFSFPPNFQASDDIVRVQVALAGDGINGTVTWLLDTASAFEVLGEGNTASENSAFPQIDPNSPTTLQGTSETHGIDLLLDIPLEISVELGRMKMLLRDVVELGTGSIVEIEKAAGEPVDVMVNGRIVARGEVVVIEDNFGVRITEILNPAERLARLSDAA